MLKTNALILQTAGAHLGLKEWPGAPDNPEIVQMFEDVGHNWVQDDETAWCAAFVGSVLAQVGLQHTGKLNARSYEHWGASVPIREARPGDIVVFWRETPDSWKGHVAILVRFDGDKVIVRGGNQGNSVSDAPYPVARIVSIRRATGNADIEKSRPLLKVGSRGAFVLDLQEQLRMLGYQLGKLDGIFGDKTRAAVVALQADNGLAIDGVVGAKTWAALEVAEPRERRAVTEEGLREAGSKTIKQADTVRKRAKQSAGGLVGLAAVDTALEAVEKVQASETALQAAQQVLMDNWAVIGVGVIGFLVWKYGADAAQRIIGRRVEDARTGKHLGR